MDRLEAALEKSRQQRAALQPAPATPITSVIGVKSPAKAFTPPNLSASEIDEELMEKNRIVAHRTRSKEADVYRQMRTKVLQIMGKSGYRTLAITSPHYGDGKTTISVNLGISIAMDMKQTVLLVDLDLRKPSLHTVLGLRPQSGLTDYLLDNVPLHESLLRPPFERLNTLPAGRGLDHSSEVLGSPKMIALAGELKARYTDRIVIYDMPPIIAQDDSLAFLPQVDAVLVVVREGHTSPEDLQRCLNSLAGTNVIGTVLNNCF